MADEQEMTGPGARAIRERLGLRVEDVAGILALTPHVVEGWESGAMRVPRAAARELRWREAMAAREAHGDDLPPLPEPPARYAPSRLTRLQDWIDQRPEWLRPSLWLAAGLGGYSLLSAALGLVRAIIRDASLDVPLGDLVAVPVSIVTGFLMGLGWTAFGPLRRRGGAMVYVANTLSIIVIIYILIQFRELRDLVRP